QDYGSIIITRPVDKRENFIKRCVAIGGDVLQVVNGKVLINGQPQDIFPQSQRYYKLQVPPDAFLDDEKLQEMGINIRESQGDKVQLKNDLYLINITNEEKGHLKLLPGYSTTDFIMDPDSQLFPYYDTTSHWSADNYGPVTIPKKGASIALTPDNLVRYQRCIEVYEGNKFENQGGQIRINGAPATSYTFKLNYFWMMGDNRHNSLDSRYWGFVPEDHVVGKASLIWFSWEGGPRWKRLFSSIK
ncbi:MAG: signal peptidase I, partial [Ferruginibacter sp.]